jgi:rod shape determining protein RodA
LPLIIGQVTRGTVRWIPIGPLSLQPSEIVRPLLFIFFANYLIKDDIGLKRLLITFLYMILPLTLILLQPSLGVTILTSIGFIGIILSSSIKKSHILSLFLVGILLLPLFWILMKPYQKVRILSFINPQNDPRGTGYNSIQSMIAVGSGGLIGRGLGKGIQTQLEFLPEKQTDFIFAAISEEFGFFGATITLGLLFFLYILLIRYAENAYNPQGRAFVSVVVLVFVAETFIHIGMNMGILPITGVPLPLLSSGGSSLMGTLITLGLVVSIKKNQL